MPLDLTRIRLHMVHRLRGLPNTMDNRCINFATPFPTTVNPRTHGVQNTPSSVRGVCIGIRSRLHWTLILTGMLCKPSASSHTQSSVIQYTLQVFLGGGHRAPSTVETQPGILPCHPSERSRSSSLSSTLSRPPAHLPFRCCRSWASGMAACLRAPRPNQRRGSISSIRSRERRKFIGLDVIRPNVLKHAE